MCRFHAVSVVFFILNIFVTTSLSSGDWCYSGACGPKSSKWKETGSICGTGKAQSPININPASVKSLKSATPSTAAGNKLIINQNYLVKKNFFLINNGHTIQLQLYKDGSSKCYMSGDGLVDAPYYFRQLHFHWGPNDGVGSEHTIAGKSFPLEMHMVHIQVKDNASIAVLSVLFNISPNDNPDLEPIITNLPLVKQATEVLVPAPVSMKINLTALLPKSMRMFRYEGSLTTPPCTEKVIWTVFQEPVPVSKKQVATFRRMLDHDNKPLMKNNRPTQRAFTSSRKNIYFMKVLKGS